MKIETQLECTVEEYKELCGLGNPKPKPVTDPQVPVAPKPKHAGGRPKKVIGKTHTAEIVQRKSNPNDGRVKMWKFIHKAAKKYTKKGYSRDIAYKKGMEDYKKSKHL